MEQRVSVLIIDDNPDDLEFYMDLLAHSEMKPKVHTAETVEAGMAIFLNETIDCILIDYFLPEQNGVDVLEDINKLSNRPIAMVILTGEPHQKIQAEAARKGALDYIVKDAHTTPEQLEDTIRKVIGWVNNGDESERVVMV